MLKKLFFISLFLCLLIGGIKLYGVLSLQTVDTVADAIDDNDEGEVKEDKEYKENKDSGPEVPEQIKTASTSKPMANLNQEEMDAFEKEIEEIEVSWQEEAKKIFTVELKLSESEFQEYLTMRKGYEEDRFEAYQQYHKENLAKKGDYPITNEDDANEKVLSEYQELFKSRFGEEALALYLKSLDGFNSQVRKKRGEDGSILTIDF